MLGIGGSPQHFLQGTYQSLWDYDYRTSNLLEFGCPSFPVCIATLWEQVGYDESF
jgi:hypothetical protein